MSTVLKLTLANGEEHTIPFFSSSTLTVSTTVAGGADLSRAYTDVVALELADSSDDTYRVSDEEIAYLDSPEAAIIYAKTLPLADAAAHIERAVLQFPDDERLAQVQADLHDAVRNNQDAWSTSVHIADDDETVAAADAWLDDPDAAVAYINQLGTIEEAEEAIAAALDRYPMHTELRALDQQAQNLRAEQHDGALAEKIRAVGSHAAANELAAELGVAGFAEKEPNLDDKKAALLAALGKKSD